MDTSSWLPDLSQVPTYEADWLLDPAPYRAGVYAGEHHSELVLANGLLRRVFRLTPNAATVGYDNLVTGAAILRGVKPEASISVDGVSLDIGGLVGQREYAYLRREWIDEFESDPQALHFVDLAIDATQAPFAWKRVRPGPDLPWPPPGTRLTLRFAGRGELAASVVYELYDGLPLLCKWLELYNGGECAVRLDSCKTEILAVVEGEVSVDAPGQWSYPDLHVESDYAFHGMTSKSANTTTHWIEDPQYTTQVNYAYSTPCLLESRLPLGPDVDIAPGATFTSFRTYELAPDSTDRERRGLSLRRMYRTLAPWTQENPILMHVRSADPASVKAAVDQCAEVGFEMVIMTFGSGFDAESKDSDYRAELKALADYAHDKKIELGGYSLLASRHIDAENDAIHPETGEPGGAIFGHSPCLGSVWGEAYFHQLEELYEQTGLDVLEHDGSYPGDLCASTRHPGHGGLGDSQWRQWQRITRFYRWCRERGVYLNVPDWYFLNGSNKNGMGYREVNWSLPRARQIMLARQNIYDGTWEKTPSMGWMFVPLVEYHGGGEEATLEPLEAHLDAYGAHLAQNFGCGVQACYRGPRLFDGDRTREVVKKWVDFYKRYRAILESDIVHLRRPDGRDVDGVLHVNPALEICGLALFFNPLDNEVVRTWKLPLYYTGLRDRALIHTGEGEPRECVLNRHYEVELELNIPAHGMSWYVVSGGA